MIRSWHSSKRSRLWIGLVLAHQLSTPTPRTKPLSTRPPEMRSAIATCSAICTGLSWIGRMLPRIKLRVASSPGEDAGGHVGRDVHARGRRVVLVDHEPVEARLVRGVVLVEVAPVV